MTKNKCAALLLITLLAIVGVRYAVDYYLSYHMDHFSCENHFVTSYDGTSVNGVLNYRFNGGQGTIEANFSLTEGNAPSVMINRVFDFTYFRQNNSYTLTSLDYFDTPYFAGLRKILPDFYLTQNSGVTYKIYNQSNRGYVFTRASSVILFCEKVPFVSNETL